MLKRTAMLLGIVLLLIGAFTFVSAEAKGYEQSCLIFINGQPIDLQSFDASQINKEVSNVLNQVLAQLKGSIPQKNGQNGEGGQTGVTSPQPAPQPKPTPQPIPQQPSQPNKEQSGPTKPVTPTPASVAGLNADEQKMVQLVNQERQKQGLAPLKVNSELVKVARAKAQDMIANGYFGHHSPTYGAPDEMLRKFGVSYRYMGENLAGNPSVEGAHQSLMNSPGHRANILNGNFKQVGIGVVDGGPYGKMFVQLFTD